MYLDVITRPSNKIKTLLKSCVDRTCVCACVVDGIAVVDSCQFEYHELATSCEDFSTQLVDKCRTTDEVQLVLSQREGHTRLKKGDKYPRILLAIEYDIKRV